MLHALYDRLFARKASAPGALQPPTQDTDGGSVVERIVCHAHAAALHTAVVTSAINGLRLPGRLRCPLALRNVLPGEIAVGELLSRGRAGGMITAPLIRKLMDFFNAVAQVRTSTLTFCADVDEYGAVHAAFLHIHALHKASLRASRQALHVVRDLNDHFCTQLPRRYGENTRVLTYLLTDVIEGGQPCLDAFGDISVPTLPQRRPAPRRCAWLSCVVEHQGITSPAIVKDISVSGVGLAQAPTLLPNKVILMELQNGRCLTGTVIWSRGSSAGIEFDSPLEGDDALFTV